MCDSCSPEQSGAAQAEHVFFWLSRDRLPAWKRDILGAKTRAAREAQRNVLPLENRDILVSKTIKQTHVFSQWPDSYREL